MQKRKVNQGSVRLPGRQSTGKRMNRSVRVGEDVHAFIVSMSDVLSQSQSRTYNHILMLGLESFGACKRFSPGFDTKLVRGLYSQIGKGLSGVSRGSAKEKP